MEVDDALSSSPISVESITEHESPDNDDEHTPEYRRVSLTKPIEHWTYTGNDPVSLQYKDSLETLCRNALNAITSDESIWCHTTTETVSVDNTDKEDQQKMFDCEAWKSMVNFLTDHGLYIYYSHENDFEDITQCTP